MTGLLDTTANSSFSRTLPGLQYAVDSTSLGEFKTCPRKYFYTIVMGFQSREQSVHLVFGILLHEARERYDHARVEGKTHDEALAVALRHVLVQTWDKTLNRPKFPEGKGPKNRKTLVQTLVWYLDEFGENDPLETVVLANGKPAVELSFSFDSGFRSKTTDEAFVLCGHMDRVAKLNDVPYIIDLKSTESQLTPRYFSQFNPNNQFSLYMTAGKVAFGVPVRGIIVDAAQVGVTFSRFQRQPVQRDEAQLEEWLAGVHWWLDRMDDCAAAQHWPMNEKSCQNYGGCSFQQVCAKSPASRDNWLASQYDRRVWDPLQRRGDI